MEFSHNNKFSRGYFTLADPRGFRDERQERQRAFFSTPYVRGHMYLPHVQNNLFPWIYFGNLSLAFAKCEMERWACVCVCLYVGEGMVVAVVVLAGRRGKREGEKGIKLDESNYCMVSCLFFFLQTWLTFSLRKSEERSHLIRIKNLIRWWIH